MSVNHVVHAASVFALGEGVGGNHDSRLFRLDVMMRGLPPPLVSFAGAGFNKRDVSEFLVDALYLLIGVCEDDDVAGNKDNNHANDVVVWVAILRILEKQFWPPNLARYGYFVVEAERRLLGGPMVPLRVSSQAFDKEA